MRLLFDCETNGLLDKPDLRILCAAALDLDSGEEWAFADTELAGLFELVGRADELVGHNIARFDVPLLDRFAPAGWRRTDRLFDTLLVSRQMFPDIVTMTAKQRNAAGRTEAEREAAIPARYLSPRGGHSLAAWGYRLGFHKGELLDVDGVQSAFSQPLLDYCVRDVQLNAKLFHRLRERGALPGQPAPEYEAMVIESRVGWLAGELERNGVRFDVKAAGELYAKLAARRDELGKRLAEWFPSWYAPTTDNEMSAEEWARSQTEAIEVRPGDAWVTVPRRTYKVKYPHNLAGREAGCAFTKVEFREFNPASDAHVANRLRKLYGWKPSVWTESGLPKMDEAVLAGLEYPPVPTLIEYKTIEKRLGQLGDGKQALLKKVKPSGLIYHSINISGARTSRASHSNPNLAQVPRVGSAYGAECRALFGPTRPGWVMIGADASGIELRMLAHRLAKWDGGAFAKTLLEGDVHAEWMRLTGAFTRDGQKTLTYAFLYGAGDAKLGRIRLDDWRLAFANGITKQKPPPASTERELGADVRTSLIRKVVGLEPLLEGLRLRFKQKWLRGLDGRLIAMEAEHGALNDLLQSDAAILMKHALVRSRELLTARGFQLGVDFAFMLWIHDELQAEARPEDADAVGAALVEAIALAGQKLGVRCPLAGQYKVGSNWKETH